MEIIQHFIEMKKTNKPIFYLYDSYLNPSHDWASILSPTAPNTIRGTKYDSLIIGLYVERNRDEKLILEANFDGFYTYFASVGFTFGSNINFWSRLDTFAKGNNLIFIPSVGPGYIDERIRPWNNVNTKSRRDGEYYKDMFSEAIKYSPSIISITSWNEWHEGSQIEPAIPFKSSTFIYENYLPKEPDYYLQLTREFITLYEQKQHHQQVK